MENCEVRRRCVPGNIYGKVPGSDAGARTSHYDLGQSRRPVAGSVPSGNPNRAGTSSAFTYRYEEVSARIVDDRLSDTQAQIPGMVVAHEGQ